jgi:iron complex outermembrane receptor protein
MRSLWVATLLLPFAGLPALAASGQNPGQGEQQDLSGLSIEELAQIPVQSASKSEEPLSTAPTALYVITADDIARSGATSLPEAVRLAPNLQVQRTNGREYAITARGFNGIETSNKILLLLDGRSAYSTLHSGIFWELRSPLLEDVAQIEVVSGPGGTLFGPNAVNGVISVVSKDATETVGALARGTAGEDERTLGGRLGLALGEGSAVRVSANYFDREGLPAGRGAELNDGIRGWQANLRADSGSDNSHVTLAGDIFRSETFLVAGDHNRGHSLLARWRGQAGDGLNVQIQSYYDYFHREQLLAEDSLETFDVEGQVNYQGGGHSVVAGMGVRTTRDQFVNNLNVFQLAPTSQRLWIFNGFIQDRFQLSPRLSVVAGVKLERSSFSGLEVLPNLRLAWSPAEDMMFWAAVSRAVRTPSRIDRDLMAANILAEAPDFESEKLVAFEIGYRGQPSASSTLSVSAFYNRYDSLRTLAFIGGIQPFQLANDMQGHSYGIEAWGTQQLLPWWRLSAGGAVLQKDFMTRPGALDLATNAALGDDPEYRFQLRSQMDLPHGLALDAGLRVVDGLDRTNIPGYAEAEARIGWHVSETLELYASGNNLLHATHLESGDGARGQRARRSVRAGARLRF